MDKEWSSDEELLEEKEEELQELQEEFRLAEEERRRWGRQVRQAKHAVERASGRLQLWLRFVREHEAGSGEASWPAAQARLGCRRRRKELAKCKRVHAAYVVNEEEAMEEEADTLWRAEALEMLIEDLRELVADQVATAMVEEVETAKATAVATAAAAAAAAAAKVSPQEVGPSGPAPGERLVAAAAAAATVVTAGVRAGEAVTATAVGATPVAEGDGSAEVVGATQGGRLAVVDAGPPAGGWPAAVEACRPASKKLSGAQVRRAARRAAIPANMEKALAEQFEAGAIEGAMEGGGSAAATGTEGVVQGSKTQDGAAAAQEQSRVFDPGGA